MTKFLKKSCHKKNYYNLCKELTNKEISSIFEYYFESKVRDIFIKKAKKDPTNWSRELVTVVTDDSVFRTWLDKQNVEHIKDFEDFYSKYYSGQFKQVVWGFQAVFLGVTIGEEFYPMYIECAKKTDKSLSAEERRIASCKGVAERLIVRFRVFTKSIELQNLVLPTLFFSADSGYSDKGIVDIAVENGLNFLGVPKDTLTVEVSFRIGENNESKGKEKSKSKPKKLNIKDLKDEFKRREAKHKETDTEPFTWRIQATIHSLGRKVILLFFRLKNSKKVSVCFCTDINAKEKTIRRHWFQRTYIEQFFKILKHVLQIQEARTNTKHKFDFKLFRFSFIAIHVQELSKIVKKKMKLSNMSWGFKNIQRMLSNCPELIQLMEQSQ